MYKYLLIALSVSIHFLAKSIHKRVFRLQVNNYILFDLGLEQFIAGCVAALTNIIDNILRVSDEGFCPGRLH